MKDDKSQFIPRKFSALLEKGMELDLHWFQAKNDRQAKYDRDIEMVKANSSAEIDSNQVVVPSVQPASEKTVLAISPI